VGNQLPLQPSTAPVRQAVAERSITQTVQLQRRTSTDVAQQIYKAFRNKSELINKGPQGLPAFQVFRDQPTSGIASGASGRLFAIGINMQTNQLVVEATPATSRQLVKMIRTLDLLQPRAGEAIQLVSGTAQSAEIARRLNPQLQKMMTRRRQGDQLAQAENRQPPAQPQNPNQPNARPRITIPGQPAQQDPQSPFPERPAPTDPDSVLIDSLRGDVDVEVVPGGLILKGNQNDIDALMKIIRQIETFSQTAVPDIHLLFVKHVNSVALSQLMTQVYEQLNTLRGRGTALPATITFIPVVKPNSILVLAPGVDMEAILELADELDQPVDPETEFEVFPLKSAVASSVVTTLTTFYPEQTQTAVGLTQRVLAVADVRTNSIIVRARPNDLIEVALLIRKIDQSSTPAVNRVRMFILKHAVADEMANVINSTIQSVFGAPGQSTTGTGQIGGGGGIQQLSQELRDAKSVALEFLKETKEGAELVRSGILADIRVTTDPRTNTLVVTAPESSMPLMSALIDTLDQPSSNVAEIKVFTLQNSDAIAIADLLENLFDTQQTGGGQNQQQAAVQIVGAEDASSSLVPLRFSVDPRTNTIVAVGGAEALRVVEAILLRLDASDLRRRQNTVIKLQNASVVDVELAVSQFLLAQSNLRSQIGQDLISNIERLEEEVIVVAEPATNSLLISCSPRYYEDILKLIEGLDAVPEQVVIQALIVEVVLDNTDEFGVELGFQDASLFGRSLVENLQTIDTTTTAQNGVQTTTQAIYTSEGSPGFNFNRPEVGLGNNILGANSQAAHIGSQGLSNFSLGRVNGDLGFGGLVLSANSKSVNILLRALSSQRTVNVLSRPQIRTIDGQFSRITVGQEFQWVTGFNASQVGGGLTPLTEPKTTGIILEVTPRITPDGSIVMVTHAEKSQVSAASGVPLVVDPVSGTVIQSPLIDSVAADTTVMVPDGQTVVIGGMITKSDTSIDRRVPWLADIPLLGQAFRYDSDSTLRTELLIFLTPRIIRTNEDSERMKQVESERMHFFIEEAESIHGPIYALPTEGPDAPPAPPAPGQLNGAPGAAAGPNGSAGNLMPAGRYEQSAIQQPLSRIPAQPAVNRATALQLPALRAATNTP
ncbi:MAG: secretin N-terminal domain-containing protein, partial [Planctomycetaceae bacterium]